MQPNFLIIFIFCILFSHFFTCVQRAHADIWFSCFKELVISQNRWCVSLLHIVLFYLMSLLLVHNVDSTYECAYERIMHRLIVLIQHSESQTKDIAESF